MIKRDIIQSISDTTPYHKDHIRNILAAAFELIKESVNKGDVVELRGFGTFHPIIKKERKGQDMYRGKTIVIPEKRFPKFVPAKEFLERLNKA